MTGEPVDQPEGKDRETKGDRDGQPSRPGDRSRMDAASAGDVEHAEASREHADERRCDRGERERKHRRTDKEDRRGRHPGGHDTAIHA
jgi:hypothetical protein